MTRIVAGPAHVSLQQYMTVHLHHYEEYLKTKGQSVTDRSNLDDHIDRYNNSLSASSLLQISRTSPVVLMAREERDKSANVVHVERKWPWSKVTDSSNPSPALPKAAPSPEPTTLDHTDAEVRTLAHDRVKDASMGLILRKAVKSRVVFLLRAAFAHYHVKHRWRQHLTDGEQDWVAAVRQRDPKKPDKFYMHEINLWEMSQAGILPFKPFKLTDKDKWSWKYNVHAASVWKTFPDPLTTSHPALHQCERLICAAAWNIAKRVDEGNAFDIFRVIGDANVGQLGTYDRMIEFCKGEVSDNTPRLMFELFGISTESTQDERERNACELMKEVPSGYKNLLTEGQSENLTYLKYNIAFLGSRKSSHFISTDEIQ